MIESITRPLDLAHGFVTKLLLTLLVVRRGLGQQALVDLVGPGGLGDLLDREARRVVGEDVVHEALEVPVLGEVGGTVRLDDVLHGGVERLEALVAKALAVEDLLATAGR